MVIALSGDGLANRIFVSKQPLCRRFCYGNSVRIGKCSFETAPHKFKIENFKYLGIGNTDTHLELFFVQTHIYGRPRYHANGFLYFRKVPRKCPCQRARRKWQIIRLPPRSGLPDNPINPISFCMPTVKTQLVLNIEHDQNARTQTNGKPQNINRAKSLLPIEISQCNNQVISKHNNPPPLQIKHLKKPSPIGHTWIAYSFSFTAQYSTPPSKRLSVKSKRSVTNVTDLFLCRIDQIWQWLKLCNFLCFFGSHRMPQIPI